MMIRLKETISFKAISSAASVVIIENDSLKFLEIQLEIAEQTMDTFPIINAFLGFSLILNKM